MGILTAQGDLIENREPVEYARLNIALAHAESAASMGSFAHPIDDRALLQSARGVRTFAEPNVVTHRPTLTGVISGHASAERFSNLHAQFQAALAYAFYVEACLGEGHEQAANLRAAADLLIATLDYAHNVPVGGLTVYSSASSMLRAGNTILLQESRNRIQPEKRLDILHADSQEALKMAEQAFDFVEVPFAQLNAVPHLCDLINKMISLQVPGVGWDSYMREVLSLFGEDGLRDTSPHAEFMQLIATGEHLFLISEAALGKAKCRALLGDKAGVDCALDQIDKLKAKHPRFSSPLLEDVYAQLRRMQNGVPFVPQSPINLHKALGIAPHIVVAKPGIIVP